MPDHIHTIPVLDALREPEGCAFCKMHKKLENDAINFVMGPSYMEDDVRMVTNRIGFCNKHLNAMYLNQNRLGLALMTHTHIMKINKDCGKIVADKKPIPFFGKDPEGSITRLRAYLEKVNHACYVCDKVDDTFERYIDTFFHIWSHGGDDARLIKEQKGYCNVHFLMLLKKAETLSKGKREKFNEDIIPVWKNMMADLEDDLDWFIQKFDHRNMNEPWKNSKDALPRAMHALGGQ